MAEFTCPSCRAQIEPDLVEKTGRAECPFCSADLSGLGLLEPAAVPPLLSNEFDSVDENDAVESSAGSAAATGSLPAVPDKSKIRVVEATGDRLVLFIPGGGKQAAGIGCFAVFWNGFMTIFTPLMVAGLLKDDAGNAPSLWFVVPFLSLFWIIGLGMAYFWVKIKYERTLLLVDRERVAVQKTLLNRKKLVETALADDAKAELVESYQQNDVPVYRIEIRGTPAPARFGTALADEEKDWLVDRVNEFLGGGVD